MKFFEVHDPYYALIKAETKNDARCKYVDTVADDEGMLIEKIEEVDRDYAVALYSRTKSEDGKVVPLVEILEDIKSNEAKVLIVDGALL